MRWKIGIHAVQRFFGCFQQLCGGVQSGKFLKDWGFREFEVALSALIPEIQQEGEKSGENYICNP